MIKTKNSKKVVKHLNTYVRKKLSYVFFCRIMSYDFSWQMVIYGIFYFRIINSKNFISC